MRKGAPQAMLSTHHHAAKGCVPIVQVAQLFQRSIVLVDRSGGLLRQRVRILVGLVLGDCQLFVCNRQLLQRRQHFDPPVVSRGLVSRRHSSRLRTA